MKRGQLVGLLASIARKGDFGVGTDAQARPRAYRRPTLRSSSGRIEKSDKKGGAKKT